MIYVTADLHGYSLEAFQQLLQSAGFGEADYLFVLGDVIDRGDDGVTLLRWMIQQPNVQMILGNHEAMLLACEFLFDPVTEESLGKLDAGKLAMVSNWMANGAAPTLAALRSLLKTQPDVLEGVLDYLHDAPLYDTVEAGGRSFVLVHGGLGNFHPHRPLHHYTAEELLWTRPTLQTKYYDDATVIFGHTPTVYFGSEYRGRAVKTDTWVCIDTGDKPMLLRLDDMKAFYG